MPNSYHHQIVSALTGRICPQAMGNKSFVLSTMGSALGFPEDDVHANRFYRVFLTLDHTGTILSALVRIDGDLISPCSGYFPEEPDEFDCKPVLEWCLSQTAPQRS